MRKCRIYNAAAIASRRRSPVVTAEPAVQHIGDYYARYAPCIEMLANDDDNGPDSGVFSRLHRERRKPLPITSQSASPRSSSSV